MPLKNRNRACRAALVVLLALAGVTGLGAPRAQAQGGASTEPAYEAYLGVAEIGRTWSLEAFAETVGLYADVHRGLEWPGVLEPELVRYGDAPEQTLRLFRPEQDFSEPGPVIVFLHGNGLGNSSAIAPDSDGLIYAHIGKLGATFGGIGVTADYRTGEDTTPFTGAEDLRLMLDWLAANVLRFGGDPDTIVLLANSEGATHAATYLFHEGLQPATGPSLAAVILSSGLFGEAAPHLAPLIESYDGERVPLALWSAQYDPAEVEIGIAELYVRLCRKYARCPWFEQLQGHNHVSHVMSLGTADDAAQNALIRFYHTVR